MKWHNQMKTKCGNMQWQTQTNWKKTGSECYKSAWMSIKLEYRSCVLIKKGSEENEGHEKQLVELNISIYASKYVQTASKWIAGKRAIKWQQKMEYKWQIQCKWMGFFGWWKSIFNQVKGNKALKYVCMTAIQNVMVKIFFIWLTPAKYI